MPTRGPHVQYRVPETPRDCPDVLPEDHDKFNRGIIPGLVWVTLYTFPHAYGRCIDVPWTWAYNHLDLASDHILAQWRVWKRGSWQPLEPGAAAADRAAEIGAESEQHGAGEPLGAGRVHPR